MSDYQDYLDRKAAEHEAQDERQRSSQNIKNLFDMVYQWGRVGVVVDYKAPAFLHQLGIVAKELTDDEIAEMGAYFEQINATAPF